MFNHTIRCGVGLKIMSFILTVLWTSWNWLELKLLDLIMFLFECWREIQNPELEIGVRCVEGTVLDMKKTQAYIFNQKQEGSLKHN